MALIERGLHPAVAAAALALSRGLGPRQPGQGPAQGRLIGLDREQIVSTTLAQPAGVAGLVVQRIGGDQDPGQVGQGGQGRGERGEAIAAAHVGLGEHQPVAVIVDGHQLCAGPGLAPGAAQG